jgi:hypothetical protein
VPGKFTVGVAVVPPAVMPGPDQLYVPPPVPVNVAIVVVQFNVLVLEALAVGAVVFCVMVVFAVAVQPLAAVTVTT